MSRKLTTKNAIAAYVHCLKCVDEWKEGQPGESSQSYSRLSVGFTEEGLQVWCERHELNVVHIDFEGHQHPANLAASEPTPPLRLVE